MVITQLRDVESVVGGGSSSRANGHAVAVGCCLDNGGPGAEGVQHSQNRNERYGMKGAYSWPSLEMEFSHWVSFISR